MQFRDMELDFDIFDANDAEAFEIARKNLAPALTAKENEPYPDRIRRQCGAISDFFDDLFGDGFHHQLFGERDNIRESLKTFCDFCDAIEEQSVEVQRLGESIAGRMPGNDANRATRRAAARNAPRQK